MSINLVEMLKSQLGGALAGQLGGRLGESEQATKSGIEAMIPTILGGLLKQVSAPGGAEKLDRTLNDGGYDGSLLDNLGGMFSGGGADTLNNKGGGLISMIFGDKIGALAPILSRLTGMKSGSVTSLLTMLLPLVMSFLGKQKRSLGLDAQGLANMLTSQKSSIAAAMPSELSSALGIGSLGAPGTASRPAPVSHSSGENAGGGLFKLLIPLAILAALAFALLNYFKPKETADALDKASTATATKVEEMANDAAAAGKAAADKIAEGAKDAAEATSAAAGKVADGVKDAATATKDAANDAMDDVKAPTFELPNIDGVPDVKSMFASVATKLNNVKDAETARAALPDLQNFDKQLGSINSSISAMPAEIKSKLTEAVKGLAPQFESTKDKLLGIPAVKDILQTVLTAITEKIKTITG